MKTIDLAAQEIAVRPFVEAAEIRGVHRMLGIKDICHLVPYSRRHIDRLVQQGLFPAPIFLSANRRAWRASAVLQFLHDREAGGQQKRTRNTARDERTGEFTKRNMTEEINEAA